MPRRIQPIPRVQMRVVSGDQEIGIGQEGEIALPPIREIIRTTLVDAISHPNDGAWGPTIQVHLSGGRILSFPTVQCIQELGLPLGRLTVRPIDWERGTS